MKKTLKIPSMMCEHCKKSIEDELTALPGVTVDSVLLETKTVHIDVDDGVTDDILRDSISAIGFEITEIL